MCALEDIADGSSRGFGDDTSSLFAVRRGEQVFVYQNRCPHAQMPLNWMPDRFLNFDKSLIICSAHGALFDIESGRCVAGPCVGTGLKAIAARVENNEVWIQDNL